MIHDKYLYKIELYLIKVIPMIISALYLLNITLSYYGIDMRIFSNGYWHIIVVYNVFLGQDDAGFTHTDFNRRLSIVAIGLSSSKE